LTSSGSGGGGSGGNTPVDMQQLGNHHLPHPAYLPSHLSHNHNREQVQNGQQQMSHHHSHHHNGHHSHLSSNGDIKPVIPTSMLGGYTGVHLRNVVMESGDDAYLFQ